VVGEESAPKYTSGSDLFEVGCGALSRDGAIVARYI
jgi:hypothetical protein